MKRIVDAGKMQSIDRYTIEYHKIPSLVLMERAALSVVEELEHGSCEFGSFDLSNVLVVCGNGNNGGDGIAIARLLHLSGRKVAVYQLGDFARMSEDCKIQTSIAESYGVTFINNPEYSEYTTIVDAVFGVGLSRAVEGKYKDTFNDINLASAKVVSVDIASGIRADNGQVLGCCVDADMTVTFAYAKIGHMLYPGKAFSGSLRVKDIGIYTDSGNCFYLEASDLEKIPKRKPDGNKGTFGKVLILAGSEGMAGAAVLCAQAVMRCGAGMAKVVTHTTNRPIVQQLVPEVMTGTYKDIDEVILEIDKGLAWADVVVCGCGLGTDSLAVQALSYLLENCSLPLVLDADALNIISKHMQWLERITTDCIITPHLGEMSRLTQEPVNTIRDNIIGIACSFSEKYKIQCVLKDAVSCIAVPDGSVYLNTSGNSGMATAGSGDVLAGMIAGLLAVHTPLSIAGALGVYLHGLCGDKAKSIFGESYMMARDIIEQICSYLR